MTSDDGRKRLLSEIILDEQTGRFQNELEQRCLQQLARRRRGITFRRGMRLAAGILLFCLGAYLIAQHPRTTEQVTVVGTDSLDEGRFPLERFSTRTLQVSGGDTMQAVAIVRTREGGGAERISEGELLAHYAGHPLALVRRPDMRAELVFLEPADDTRFRGT